MKNHNNDDWLKKEVMELRELNKKEEQLKRMLAKMIDNHEKEMAEHRRWLRQHDVRLTEHWKHISKR